MAMQSCKMPIFLRVLESDSGAYRCILESVLPSQEAQLGNMQQQKAPMFRSAAEQVGFRGKGRRRRIRQPGIAPVMPGPA